MAWNLNYVQGDCCVIVAVKYSESVIVFKCNLSMCEWVCVVLVFVCVCGGGGGGGIMHDAESVITSASNN